eukprot:symbB.v1.2.007705.t1/scaffold477.1/size198972/4
MGPRHGCNPRMGPMAAMALGFAVFMTWLCEPRGSHREGHLCVTVPVVSIDSKRNNAFKVLKKLGSRKGRRKLGRFVAEGETFLRMRPRSIFVRQSRFDEVGLDGLKPSDEEAAAPQPAMPLNWGGGMGFDLGDADVGAAPVAVLKNDLFDEISSQEKSQGVLCIFGLPQDMQVACQGTVPVTSEARVVILDGVEDPNNLGVILRTMEAFGSRTLLVTKGTVDVYNAKVVRCSMGATVRQQVRTHEVLAQDLKTLLPNYRFFATHLGDDAKFQRPAVPSWFGNEARGVSEELVALAQERLRIPMVPGVDSLNVGVSVGIVLHQALGAAVQRRRDGTKDGRQKERFTLTLPET